jgi:hypothetical protein
MKPPERLQIHVKSTAHDKQDLQPQGSLCLLRKFAHVHSFNLARLKSLINHVLFFLDVSKLFLDTFQFISKSHP